MTDTVSLSVKWGKETIDLDFIVAGGVKGLKTELEEKTRVPADRMKLMAKSKGELTFLIKFQIIYTYIYIYRYEPLSDTTTQLFQVYGKE
jgi:hypothetical protein